MEELVRDRIHEALEIEPTPASLRARVMGSLPVDVGPHRPTLRFSGQWAAGLVAILLGIAIIAGLLYSRGLAPFIPAHPQPAPQASLVSPEGVAIGPDGAVYVSDFLGDRVFELRPDGRVVVYAGGGSGSDGPALKASLFHPAGIAVDSTGTLYIADTPGGTVRKVDTRGMLSTLGQAKGLTYGYAGPLGLATDRSNVLWVSQMFGNVGRADGLGGLVDGSSLPQPTWIPGYLAFDNAGNLFISDRAPGLSSGVLYAGPPTGGGCRIVRMTAERQLSVIAGTGVCGYSGDGGPATAAQLNDPGGIAFDSAGNLYFADANNHRIRRIDRNGTITTVAGTGVQGFVDGSAAQVQLQFPFGLAMTRGGLLYFADMTCQCWDPSVPGRLRVLNTSTGVVTSVITGSTPIG